jgi:hypothetical protein
MRLSYHRCSVIGFVEESLRLVLQIADIIQVGPSQLNLRIRAYTELKAFNAGALDVKGCTEKARFDPVVLSQAAPRTLQRIRELRYHPM